MAPHPSRNPDVSICRWRSGCPSPQAENSVFCPPHRDAIRRKNAAYSQRRKARAGANGDGGAAAAPMPATEAAPPPPPPATPVTDHVLAQIDAAIGVRTAKIVVLTQEVDQLTAARTLLAGG